ncbi:MAG TPA: type II CAAX endopeptidase family protein [Bryobacteraceae bacterium]|jgi:membrane protease YdiL (CAAX protease family)|nr:type II CAAX endopeptidase family protein [Bryobacteraceae bacterium]
MEIGVLGLLLAAVLAFFAPAVQNALRRVLAAHPRAIWLAPALLAAVFAGAAALANAFRIGLILLVFAYLSLPVICLAIPRAGMPKRPGWADFAAILALWLPLEFAAGAPLVPRHAQGFLHSVAYGIAILLGLTLWLGFRPFPGMKYNLPRRPRDWWLPAVGFAAVAPALIVVGIAIGFIPAPHLPNRAPGTMAAAAGIIFAGTALPEEILFRALIQNFLMLRFGGGWRTLLAASVIFGAAHLDNGPQTLPNWRYMIEATIAGIAYGRVFQQSSSVTSSAMLHMAVDWTKHFFF